MRFIADLHVHSYLSRATSPDLNLENLHLWARRKGITVVGTGDFTHPGWFEELKQKLVPAEDGLFRLKDEFVLKDAVLDHPYTSEIVRFMLSVEISSIYKYGERVRKVHNVVFVPDLEAASKFRSRLARIGNVESDGRPILGLDSHDLLEIVLESSDDAFLVPAHIWTPWFSVLGSKSGFDSINECFRDLSGHIFAVETGLSSDPPMNWRIKELDAFTLISNSDAHSPSKLGREANLFDTKLSYYAIRDAMRVNPVRTGASRLTPLEKNSLTGLKDGGVKPLSLEEKLPPTEVGGVSNGVKDSGDFLGTIEFFPEEGKYHYDGHRKCKMRMNPRETVASSGICPVCSRPVTVGVMHRVEELSDRREGGRPDGAHPFHSLVSLKHIISEVLGVGENSKAVKREYEAMLKRFGSEFHILMEVPIPEVEMCSSLLAEGLKRMRSSDLHIEPGYDGQFGEVRIFKKGECEELKKQMCLFDDKNDGLRVAGCGLRVKKNLKANIEYRMMNVECRSLKTRMKDECRMLNIPNSELRTPNSQLPTPDSLSSDNSPSSLNNLQSSIFNSQSSTPTLNPAQRQAACAPPGPILIVAGPGTGKTLALTQRIAYLIREKGLNPGNVLAITFTNKAAGEMEERLNALIGDHSGITIKTFHALCLEILRCEGRDVGLDPCFSIYDDEDRLLLIKNILKKKGDGKNTRRILDAISYAKVNLCPPTSTLEAKIYSSYQDALRDSMALDLDDLILTTIKLFEENSRVLDRYRKRFRAILVDEYQDINHAQYRLIRLLAPSEEPCSTYAVGHGPNLMAIGDPNQAIYGFRGSDVKYFNRFREDYPGALVISLDQNYRSTEYILKSSSRVISSGGNSSGGSIWSGIRGDLPLQIIELLTEKAEAHFIVHQIERLMGGTSHLSVDSGYVDGATPVVCSSFSDFAVLYRIREVGRIIEEAFGRSGIPYRRFDERKVADINEVKDVISCLRFIQNPESAVDLLRIKDKERIYRLMDEVRGNSVVDIITAILGLQKIEIAGNEAISGLISEAGPFGDSIQDFLGYISLKSRVDDYDPRAEAVTLITLHASKGLEFPVVFIAGCEDGLVPYRRQITVRSDEFGVRSGGKNPKSEIRNPKSQGEERRLFYVGMTRAGEMLFLTHAKKRRLFGQVLKRRTSPFLSDIEEELRENLSPLRDRRRPPRRRGEEQLSLF